MKSKWLSCTLLAAFCSILFAFTVFAQEVDFTDPVGDDNGPGNYTYPTDGAYLPGSFDLTGFKMKISGDQANFEITVRSKLEDPWRMGVGFAVQMAFIFVNTGEGTPITKGLPGTNVQFSDGWNRCIILSPQSATRVRQEADGKAGDMAKAILIPKSTRGSGSKIFGSVPLKDIGTGDPTKWGFQVIMQSNEGFPDKGDLLTRKVNEYEGQHRFGGGNDGDCDPHVMDILGDDQKAQLTYECNDDGTSKKMATLHMVNVTK